jgi:hypothetical protein
MPSLKSIFFQDLGTKALALILALAVWVHVFSGQEREMTFRIPLSVAPLPPQLALAGEVPDELRLRVRATGAELVKLKTRSFDAQVTVEDPQEGNLQRPILGTDVRFPRGIRPAVVDILGPRLLNLAIEPVESRLVPVAIRFTAQIPQGQALVEPPQADPASVQLSGPRSVLAATDSVEIEPLQWQDRWGRLELPVKLRLPQGLSAESESVRVVLEVEPRRVERYGPLAIEVISSRPDSMSRLEPDSGTVIVNGAASVVDGIKASRVRMYTDLRGLASGLQTAPLQALIPGLPRGSLAKVVCVPESVLVEID